MQVRNVSNGMAPPRSGLLRLPFSVMTLVLIALFGCTAAPAATQSVPTTATTASDAPLAGNSSAPAATVIGGRDLSADAVSPYINAILTGDVDGALAMIPDDRRTDDMRAGVQMVATALQDCDSDSIHPASTLAQPSDTVTVTLDPPCGSMAGLLPTAPAGFVGTCTVEARIEIGVWYPTSVPDCTGASSLRS